MSRHSGRKRVPANAVPGATSTAPPAVADQATTGVKDGDQRFLNRLAARWDVLQRHPRISSTVFLAGILAFGLSYMAVSFSRSWFFSSDEYVIAGEVIRFANLDLHQHYFDMPGTPFIALSAVLWVIFRPFGQWLAPEPASPFISPPPTILDFTYKHLDWLFNLLRGETIFFWACSLILIFFVGRKLMNNAGACVSCLVLMLSPIYASYSTFSRVESLAICLVLSAVLIVYRALDSGRKLGSRPSWRDPMILAGLLVGVAAGARLHSVTASGSLLFLVLLCDKQTPRREEYPRWLLSTARFVLPIIVIGGLVGFWATKQQMPEFPHAASLLGKAAIALAVMPVVAVLSYSFRKTRPMLLRLAGPEAIKIGIGGILGFLLVDWTIFPQFKFFLQSVEMYSSIYVDPERIALPLLTNIRWYVTFYAQVFAPTAILLVLFLTAAVLIFIHRDRRLLPYLLTVLLFFVSKPINLKAAPHHTMLWQPFVALLCAYPVARLYSFLRDRGPATPERRLVASFAATLAWAAIALLCQNGVTKAATSVRSSQGRLENIARATEYIDANAPLSEMVAVGYLAFNREIFYEWMRQLEVPIRGVSFTNRRYMVWWGKRDQIIGLSGYILISQGRSRAPVDHLPTTDPNHNVNPYIEPEFQRVVQFGQDDDSVDIFHFDFSNQPKR